MKAEEVLSRFGHLHKQAGYYMARCPAHEDAKASLKLTPTDDRLLVKCFAGCAIEDVCRAAGIELGDLFCDGKARMRDETVATYDYVDEEGRLLFQVVRKAGKRFVQRRPEGDGWAYQLNGVRRVLYRLPDVLRAVEQGKRVYVVEGEKDVAAVVKTGGVATCNPGGAGKWRSEYSEHLRGADVVVVADKDEPGRKHAQQVAASLDGLAASVVVLEPAEGKDVADHLAAGLTLDQLVGVDADKSRGMVADTPFFVDWSEFWAKDRREADWAFDDVLAHGRGHSIVATGKTGKSLLTLYVAVELVKAGAQVIYLDYEMGEDDLYERLDDMGYGAASDLDRLHYALLPSLPPLDSEAGAKALFSKVDAVIALDPKATVVVVIDTTARAVAGEENSADTVRGFYRHTGIGLKQRGVAWVRLDHEGKDPARGARGSSAKGDDVDVVWHLTSTDNGLKLRRKAARMGWVPEEVVFRRLEDPLRFVRVEMDWPAGTKEVADQLDALGVPLSAGERPVAQALKDAGQGRKATVVRAAQKWRRARETGRDAGRDAPPSGGCGTTAMDAGDAA